MFICDLCNSVQDGEGFAFSSPDIRVAFRGGLRPPSLPELGELDVRGLSAFKALVMSDAGDWELCERCSSRVTDGIEAFRQVIRKQHMNWIEESSIWLAGRAWNGFEEKRRGVVRVTLVETETVVNRKDLAFEYVAMADVGDSLDVNNEIRMCSAYDPECEFVVSFRYLTADGELATSHSYRIRPPVFPPEAAKIDRNYRTKRSDPVKPKKHKAGFPKKDESSLPEDRLPAKADARKQSPPLEAMEFDTFISYASEDTQFANELAGGLKARGVRVWYAPLNLGLGDKLLAGIEDGLRHSRTGTIIISKHFLQKEWTGYELDILLRQAIEHNKRLLQIWHGVTKRDVEDKYMGLVGLLAIDSSGGIRSIIGSIAAALTEFAPLRATTPIWEDLQYRFLNGTGEIQLQKLGGATISIYELLVNFGPEEFPLAFEGELFSRKDLATHIGRALVDDPAKVQRWLSSPKQVERLWEICKEEGVDPETLEP